MKSISDNIEGIDKYTRRFTYNRNNRFIRYAIGILRYFFKMKRLTNWINHYELLNECRDAELTVVIGGDNYDKAYGAFSDMHSFNKTLRKIIRGKMIFLNCSMNPDEIDNAIIKDLNLFDKVTVREKITFFELSKFFSKDRIEYYPDIAFVMDAEPINLPRCFKEGKVVGINLSPLILRKNYTANAKTILLEYHNIIDYCINDMGCKVLLIPHVMQNMDLSILSKLYEKYKKDDRVCLLDNEKLTSPELKYIISNCYMYLGARTHSTIAAYSACVPTLVLGYSVKSVGIARDIFGTEEGYVIPVQEVVKRGNLLTPFYRLSEKREVIYETLESVMPEYLQKANQYSDFFDALLE